MFAKQIIHTYIYHLLVLISDNVNFFLERGWSKREALNPLILFYNCFGYVLSWTPVFFPAGWINSSSYIILEQPNEFHFTYTDM